MLLNVASNLSCSLTLPCSLETQEKALFYGEDGQEKFAQGNFGESIRGSA